MWKQLWWNCFDIMHNIQSLIYFIFFIDRKLYILCDFLQFCQYYVGGMWTKHKKEQMWKHVMSLVKNQMKMCFKPKIKMKVIIELNILGLCRIVFLSSRLGFFMKRFCHEFSMFEHAPFFFMHYGLHSLKVLSNKWCSLHYVCIMFFFFLNFK